MNLRERKLYRLEVALIRRHFQGLRPRPVQLVKSLGSNADGEAGEPNLLVRDRKRTRQELENLLMHELIHYQLRDDGKDYQGHGEAFLRRARKLKIVDPYVLQQCFSAEEYEHTPTIRKTKKIPLAKFKSQVDRWFNQLLGALNKLSDAEKVKLYPYVQNAYAGWSAYSAAVRKGKKVIFQETWQRRRGPRGKGLHDLQAEFIALKAQCQSLQKKIRKSAKNALAEKLRRELARVKEQMARINRKLEKDYAVRFC